MSKDIWHKPSEAPAYCFLCVFEDSFDDEVHCGHYNPVKKQFCSTEGRYEINQVKKYCDLLHLLDCEQELIRTRKALNFAISTLTVISEGLVIEHSVVGHEDDNKIKLAKIALDKIKTELEQKDEK